MANRKQKLELTWIGKDEELKLEPRILIEDSEKSYGDPNTENMLIHGDNLLALKALEQDFTGRIKCIYIDPPYNTGNAFENYDDNLEHSIWLNLMRPRLEILNKLLSRDGAIFVQIDDSEGSYLKVLMDEIFTRNNYEVTIYVQVRYAGKTLAEKNNYQKLIEQIHCYRKSDNYQPNKELEDYSLEKFEWNIVCNKPNKVIELKGRKVEVFLEGNYEINKVPYGISSLKETWATGTVIKNNASGKFFNEYLAPRVNEDGLKVLYKVYGIGEDGLGYRYFTGPKKATATKGKFYSGVPTVRVQELADGQSSKQKSLENFWNFADAFGNCRLEGGVGFRGGKKPERLLEKILFHATKEGDLVLDSFLGSASTAAAAHKMNRRWIGIELGDHASTLCLPRLKSVVDGTDKTGITNDVDWKGGGGFKYYDLAPSLLRKDSFGNFVIDESYNPNMLAAAVCKHEAFKYSPDDSIYWKHGRSTETDFIFVTTVFVTMEQLESIHAQMLEYESLLICAKSFAPGIENKFVNITVKKIPQVILGKCEFGQDNYDLNIIKATEDQADDAEDDQNEQ